MSSQYVTQKVSKTQQKRIRIAKKRKRASEQAALIASRIANKELRDTLKLIAEEAAKKAEKIESDKEVKRKKIEKAKAEEELVEKQKEAFHKKISKILSFYPVNRDYILAKDNRHPDKVYIFLLPESYHDEYSRLAELAIQHTYKLNDFRHISSQEVIPYYINFRKNGKSDKYVFVGFDEKSGLPPKPFDTYLNQDFWSAINNFFDTPIQNAVEDFYENVGQNVEFKREFFGNPHSTNNAKTDDSCYHEDEDGYGDGVCPHDYNNTKCPSRPETHYTNQPDKDTFGFIFVPFMFIYCCGKQKHCVLKCEISYKKIGATLCNEGTWQIGITIDKTFYPLTLLLSKQNSIDIGSISNGIFKPEELCKGCKLELETNNAIYEVAGGFEMSVDEFSCSFTTEIINGHRQTIIGEKTHQITGITGDCPNPCVNNRKPDDYSDGSNDSDDSDGYYTRCQKCREVERVVNSGNVLKITQNEDLFSIFKFPQGDSKTKQIMPKYLFKIKSQFTQANLERMFLYSICLRKRNFSFELIEYILEFLIIGREKFRRVDTPIVKLIQLDSLKNYSLNLTLAKTLLKEEEDLIKKNNSVKKFYPKPKRYLDLHHVW